MHRNVKCPTGAVRFQRQGCGGRAACAWGGAVGRVRAPDSYHKCRFVTESVVRLGGLSLVKRAWNVE